MKFLANARSKFNQVLTACMLALSLVVMAPIASATSPGAVAADAIEATGPQVTLVIGAMVGVLVLIVAWKLIKRAFN